MCFGDLHASLFVHFVDRKRFMKFIRVSVSSQNSLMTTWCQQRSDLVAVNCLVHLSISQKVMYYWKFYWFSNRLCTASRRKHPENYYRYGCATSRQSWRHRVYVILHLCICASICPFMMFSDTSAFWHTGVLISFGGQKIKGW